VDASLFEGKKKKKKKKPEFNLEESEPALESALGSPSEEMVEGEESWATSNRDYTYQEVNVK
jgi:hypothetical protein